MTYFQRIQEIKRNFIAGFLDRESSLVLFEDILHEYGLLPKDENIARTITTENFLGLLKLAMERRDPHSARDPMVSDEVIAQSQAIEMVLTRPSYRLTDSILQSCPVCQAKVNGVYNRMAGADNQTIPVDPPRCKACMMLWIEEKFGSLEQKPTKFVPEYLSVSIDVTTVSPMDAAEIDFFKEYERQMAEKPD